VNAVTRKRTIRAKRVRKIGRVRGANPFNVTRTEFDAVMKLLDERGETINEIRRELHATCSELAEQNRRELQTQFMRIAQLQQEIDELKRKNNL
jgi:hypothetical protein